MTAATPPHPHGPLPADKPALRAAMRAQRTALDADVRRAAQHAVSETLLALPELAGDGPVLLYAATGDELSIDEAIAGLLARGTAVCLPRVRGETLDAVRIHGLDGLVPGWRGVREPPAGDEAVPADMVRACVVPGLAFDTAGNRLGYGGGHFDRLLARLDGAAAVVGVAFDIQVVPHLPAEPHDRPVHVVVTECRVVRPG